jgi:putative ABC transport system permease protein
VNHIALKMLMGDKGKYLGIVMGLTFASLIMTQQPAIFLGLMTRTYSFITDVGLPDIWVMDPKVQFVDDIKPLQDTELYRVRGISGVEWAMPMYKGLLKARLFDGRFQTCNVVGLDDATLIGGPPVMLEGKIDDLRRSDSVIVDIDGAKDKLGKPSPTPGGKPIALKIGDSLELNDRRAIVVGIAKVTRTFQSQPVVYTTYSRAKSYAPKERKLLSFVLVKAKQGQDPVELTRRIREKGSMRAAISGGDRSSPEQLAEMVRNFPQMEGANLVGEVTCAKPYFSYNPQTMQRFQLPSLANR